MIILKIYIIISMMLFLYDSIMAIIVLANIFTKLTNYYMAIYDTPEELFMCWSTSFIKCLLWPQQLIKLILMIKGILKEIDEDQC